jgi:hypothetical protein
MASGTRMMSESTSVAPTRFHQPARATSSPHAALLVEKSAVAIPLYLRVDVAAQRCT